MAVPAEANINFTGDCLADLKLSLFNQQTPYYDATGKLSSGVTVGNNVWLGQFKYCRTLAQSLYCLADVTAKVKLPEKSNQTNVSLRWGLCAIDSCNGTLLKDNFDTIWNETSGLPLASIDQVDVNCSERLDFSPGLYATLSLLLLLVFMVCIGTVSDLWLQHRDSLRWKLVYSLTDAGPQLVDTEQLDTDFDSQTGNESPSPDSSVPAWQRAPNPATLTRALTPKPGICTQVLGCFSLYQTFKRLASIPQTSGKGTIPCLNGIRVICISWIVLGHTFLAMFSTGLIVNPNDGLAYTKTVAWQPIGNAYFAVDTFFLLGGILVSFLGFQEIDRRNGSFPLGKFYLHRYLRLTPLVGVIMLMWIYLKPYVGDGPQWYTQQADTTCEQYWWTNLLYIQNFYPTSAQNMCIGWVWYLALDWQFYLISPFILYTLYRSQKVGMVLISVLMLASFIVTGVLIGYYNIQVNLTGSVIDGNAKAMEAFATIIHDKPYCRIAPYLVGMALGYMLFIESSQPRRRISIVTILIGWMLSLSIMAALLYGLYPTFHGHKLPLVGNIIYGTFARFTWSLAVTWVIYACHHGYGGPVGDFLSWPGFVPFSRLTYPVYLFHPVLMFIIYNSQYWPIFISNFTVAAYFVSVLAMAFVGSVMLAVIVEIPVQNLERLAYS